MRPGVASEETLYEELDRYKDLTNRLRSTLGKMELALAEIAEAIAWTDGDRTVRWCNGAFDRLVDRTHMQVLGQDLATLLPLTIDGQPVGLHAHPASRAVGGSSNANRLYEHSRGDEQRLLSISWGRLPTEVSAVVTIRDVTEERQMEQRVLRAQKLEALGQLSAGIAHEINTPLQYVSDSIDYVGRGVGHILDEITRSRMSVDPNLARVIDRVPEGIADAAEGIERIASIVRSMQSLAHPGGDAKTAFNLNEIVSQFVDISASQWRHVASVAFDLDPTLPPALGHPGMIGQVIVNLVVNAAQAIDSVGSGLGTIAVRSWSAAGFGWVSVSDSGPGIPPDIQHRIFDPFFTTKAVGTGTGQGLALVHQIVTEGHGGEIGLRSSPEAGTTISFSVPLTGAEHQP